MSSTTVDAEAERSVTDWEFALEVLREHEGIYSAAVMAESMHARREVSALFKPLPKIFTRGVNFFYESAWFACMHIHLVQAC